MNEPKKIDSIEEMLAAIWAQKQLDDMFLMLQQVLQQMKGADKFNPKFIKRRDQLKHDIGVLQPIVWETGIGFARYIEEKYNVKFMLMDGKEIPKPGPVIETEKT